jgi:hypothetical protein
MIWAIMSILAGALGKFFFKLDFFWASVIAGIALITNGFIAGWEDRDKN